MSLEPRSAYKAVWTALSTTNQQVVAAKNAHIQVSCSAGWTFWAATMWQRKHDPRAVFGLAGGPDSATVRLDDPACNRQTQPRAAGRARA